MSGTGIFGKRVAHVASSVSNLELLLDLVFVFTIIQVTEVVVEHPDWEGLGEALALLALVFYMYGGYIWLMNQTAPDTVPVRIALIAAMATFLVIAAAIPHAFGETRLVFGVAYLVVVIIHHTLFVVLGSSGNIRGILRVGPFNLLAAIVLVVGGFASESLAWVFYPAAILIILIGTTRPGRGAFDLGATHLIERHGLLMIIALGESIVAVGSGAAAMKLDVPVIAFAVLAVGVVGGMWWVYFAGDDGLTEQHFRGEGASRRQSLAITAFFGDHLGMMFGLVVFAAGIRLVVPSLGSPPSFPASVFMGGGVALFLGGSALFRGELHLGGSLPRVAGSVLAIGIGALGIVVNPLIDLALLLVVVIATCAAASQRRWRPPIGDGSTTTGSTSAESATQ